MLKCSIVSLKALLSLIGVITNVPVAAGVLHRYPKLTLLTSTFPEVAHILTHINFYYLVRCRP